MLSLILKGGSICAFAILLLTDIDERVQEIMQDVKVPEKEVRSLIKAKKLSSEKLSENMTILISKSKDLEKVPYPEKEFNELAKKLNTRLKKVMKNIEENSLKEISGSWKAVKNVCYECHNLYK